MNKNSAIILAASIILSALCVSISNRYKPSPVNESFVIDSWTGDIYDIQGNNLTDLHKNMQFPEPSSLNKTDEIKTQ